jgi:adhesin/invasin
VTNNNDGTYTATLTSSTTVQTATITGTLDLAAITDNATVAFAAGAPTKYLVISSNYSPTAGGDVTITAQLSDTNDNPVSLAGQTITWSDGATGGAFFEATTDTDGTGQAQVTYTTSATVGTVHAVTANDGAYSGISPNITTQADIPRATPLSLPPHVL